MKHLLGFKLWVLCAFCLSLLACDSDFFRIKGEGAERPAEEQYDETSPQEHDEETAQRREGGAQDEQDPYRTDPTPRDELPVPDRHIGRQPSDKRDAPQPKDEDPRAQQNPRERDIEKGPAPSHATSEDLDASSRKTTDVRPHPDAPKSFADLVERVQPAVVNVYTEQVIPQREVRVDPIYGPYSVTRPHRATSLGSGFIFDKDGYILTNTHVIDGANTVKVSTSDGTEIPAAIIGTDPATDIALLKIRPFEGMKVLPIGDSDKVRVGDWLMAVGNPFGLQSTVTTGILSARGRTDVPIGGEVRYIDFLQTDASINPGNSGGPLIAMDGTVVGINTAINAKGQGIGFAIPINMTDFVLEDLRSGRDVARSWLGVQVAETERDRQGNKQRGARIAAVVRDGPAAQAGIRPGDIVLQLGDNEIQGPRDLSWLASTAGIDTQVPVVVRRNSEEIHLTVRMGKLPN